MRVVLWMGLALVISAGQVPDAAAKGEKACRIEVTAKQVETVRAKARGYVPVKTSDPQKVQLKACGFSNFGDVLKIRAVDIGPDNHIYVKQHNGVLYSFRPVFL